MGTYVVSGSWDEAIKIWNPLTGACVQTLKRHPNNVSSVTVLYERNPLTGECVRKVEGLEGHFGFVESVTVLYDRSTSGRLSRALCGAGEDGAGDDVCRAFVVSGSGDETIKIWNPLTGACVQTLKGHS